MCCLLHAAASSAQDTAKVAHTDSVAAVVERPVVPTRYVTEMKPYLAPIIVQGGVAPYYDYDEAIAASAKLKKPVLLYFAAINSVQSRNMEKRMWSNLNILKMLKHDFVVAILYCDEKEVEIPVRQQNYSKFIHRQVIHVGDRNAELQEMKFGTNGQPMYYSVDEKFNKMIAEPFTYSLDAQKFIDYLNKVKESYAATH
jgi:thiol:disulfide interchange protein DsbD